MKALAVPNGCKAMLDQRDHATIRQAGEGGRDLLHVVTGLFLLDDAPSHASRDHYAFIGTLQSGNPVLQGGEEAL
jgi:hypothetical protein